MQPACQCRGRVSIFFSAALRGGEDQQKMRRKPDFSAPRTTGLPDRPALERGVAICPGAERNASRHRRVPHRAAAGWHAGWHAGWGAGWGVGRRPPGGSDDAVSWHCPRRRGAAAAAEAPLGFPRSPGVAQTVFREAREVRATLVGALP